MCWAASMAITSAASAKPRALIAGAVDAACMIDSNHLLFINEGTLPAGATRALAQTGRTTIATSPRSTTRRATS